MRMIDADELKKAMERMLCPGKDPTEERYTCDVVCCVIDDAPTVDAEPVITGETSDGYHTFNELYHHRAVLFSVIVKAIPEKAWKSRKHHDGTMYDGMFIVGIETPEGQATYHYDIDPYWDMFRCKEIEFAPEWDGHTPEQAIERIGKLAPVPHGRWKSGPYLTVWYGPGEPPEWECTQCRERAYNTYDYCPNCGAKMDGGTPDENT